MLSMDILPKYKSASPLLHPSLLSPFMSALPHVHSGPEKFTDEDFPGVGAVPPGGGGADDAVPGLAEHVQHPHGRHLDAHFVLGDLKKKIIKMVAARARLFKAHFTSKVLGTLGTVNFHDEHVLK